MARGLKGLSRNIGKLQKQGWLPEKYIVIVWQNATAQTELG